MTEFQLSSKYPDGTIAVAKGDNPELVVAQFLDFRSSYEEASGTAAVRPFQGPSTTTPEQGVANAQNAFQGAQVSSQPAAPQGARPQDGDFLPDKCSVCGQSMKLRILWKKDHSKQFKKMECSNDYNHDGQKFLGFI